MNPNDRQVGGDHYRKHKIQHWDFAARLPYLEGCATKYIVRHADKDGIEDLLKAKHYIDKILAIDYQHVDTAHSLHLHDLEKAKVLLRELQEDNITPLLMKKIQEFLVTF